MKIRNDEGIKSAKYWLNPSKKNDSESKGFIKLKELGKLGISLEAVVLKYPFNNLFTNAELEIAMTRRVKAGYNGPELQDDLLQKQVTEEIHDPEIYPEGSKHVITVNAYERNPEARRKFIEHFGTTCFVCGFNFENFYGPDFRDFIHIHHLVLLSSVGDKYIVDPIKDLIPVCPNCHAAIHRKNPQLTFEQIKLHVLNTRAKPQFFGTHKTYEIFIAYNTDYQGTTKSITEFVTLLKTKTRKTLILRALRFKEVVPPAPKESLFILLIIIFDTQLRI